MSRIHKIISSLQTGIILLVALTLLSLIGVIIPQGLESERYLHRLGGVVGSLVVSVGFDRLFSTLWYNVLLGVFALNVLLCTVNRTGASLALLRPGFLNAGKIGLLAHHAEFPGRGTVEATRDCVTGFLRKHRFSVAVNSTADGVLVDARKGTLRELGSALLHLSLLPLLIGGLIGKMTGFSYMEQLCAGESAPVRERQFSVRCDFFELEKNKDGDIKDYKSGLTLLNSAGDTLVRKVIEVNHPLIYKGIKFYQSSYRSDPFKVDNVRLVVKGSAVGAVGKGVVVHPGTPSFVDGTILSVSVDRFIPDFWIDMETRQPESRSNEHNNPAFFVTVVNGTDTLLSNWVFQKFGAMHHGGDSCSVSLMNYEPQYSTGLLVKENPGGPAIWAGIVFMSIGVMLVFWVPRRRVRIAITTAGDRVAVTAGSSRNRNDPESEQHFSETVSALAVELKV